MGIVQDLKERRLVQFVLSYLAAGWVATEVVSTLVERGVVPEILYFIALVWYVGGMVAAFIIGWNHGEKGRQKAPRSEQLMLTVLAFVVLAASGFTVVRMSAPPVDLDDFGMDRSRIAVLYFEDISPRGELQHVANGMAERLSAELDRVSGLHVVSPAGVRQYQQEGASRDSLARALQAGTLVGGVVERIGDRIRVALALYDGESGSLVPDGRIALEPRPLDQILDVQDDMVEQAARLLRSKLGTEVRLQRRARETNATAWTLVQRAEKLRRDAERIAEDDMDAAFRTFDDAHLLLDQAARADTTWAEPLILRADSEYRKTRLAAARQRELDPYFDAGIRFANAALERDPGAADAFEIRGQLQFWKHKLNIESDAARQQSLLDRARADLERAVDLDPHLARAYSTLSSVYYDESRSKAVLAARRAYEEDPYLDAADEALWRLYVGNLDMELWKEADRFCNEGARRFPDSFRFVYCQLQLMATPALEPDPDRAWSLAARLDSVAPPGLEEYLHFRGLFDVAGVLARAAGGGSSTAAATADPVLLDSARSLLDRASARISRGSDFGEDLIWMEAYSRTLAGQDDRAIELLRRAVSSNPHHLFGRGGEVGWQWRGLQSHPEFQQLRAAADH